MGTKSIVVGEETYRVFRRGAETAGVSDEAWLRRLVGLNGEERAGVPEVGPPHQASSQKQRAEDEGQVDIYAVYGGERVEGIFDRRTTAVTITAGPEEVRGRTFPKPSPAATAAVAAINPNRQYPNTRGWTWWRVKATNKPLDSLR